jgi:hypothetical protein
VWFTSPLKYEANIGFMKKSSPSWSSSCNVEKYNDSMLENHALQAVNKTT